ncbi:MAG: PqqD family protein [Candidatus Omnitrophica bacterium]|nr:PqqD family protein [Candidatus Omnitrophota bacterium]
MADLKKVFNKNKDFVTREIDDELILMPIYSTNKDINEMYTLNESAAKMWSLVDGKNTLAQIVEGVLAEYDADKDQVEKDVQEFVKDMLEIKAIS